VHSTFLKDAWEVLLLFLVPVGGGIPAGVVLAKSRGLSWLVSSVLYFISDVILACVFEPIMILVIRLLKRTQRGHLVRAAYLQSLRKIMSRYHMNPGPFALVMISFGTDPMTGRSIARLVGHGFLAGWALTISGDMIFFWIIMGSTLWLNSVLGDGTWAAVIVMVAMLVIPALIRKLRAKPADHTGGGPPA
jgi:hypothetical protein